LTTWSEEYYHPPTSIRLKLRAGATPYRCAACRCNFASFLKCKEKFSWRHKTRIEVGAGREAALTPDIASLNNLSATLNAPGRSYDDASGDHQDLGSLAPVSASRESNSPRDESAA
jgi:hypothetical protein